MHKLSSCFVLSIQDLEARAAHLEECKASLDDAGPLHDCVVWKGDGGVEGGEEGWWAAVDTKENGDLTEAVAMTDFDKVCVRRPLRCRIPVCFIGAIESFVHMVVAMVDFGKVRVLLFVVWDGVYLVMLQLLSYGDGNGGPQGL